LERAGLGETGGRTDDLGSPLWIGYYYFLGPLLFHCQTLESAFAQTNNNIAHATCSGVDAVRLCNSIWAHKRGDSSLA